MDQIRSKDFLSSPGPLWLVVKFAENGSLINYLQSHRQETGHGYENIDNNKTDLEYAEKLKFAYGIARGMNHLAKQRVRVYIITTVDLY